MNLKPVFVLALLASFLVVWNACKRDPLVFDNPYSAFNPSDTLGPAPEPDPASFAGIQQNILTGKCAMPGCHDGHFEPDFRTIQSSYNTLVYHPVIKQLSPWEYRVMPGDTAMSWLWQRINHELIVSGTDTSQGRMPLYAEKLTPTELQYISDWIMNGAKDMFGQAPVEPNEEPRAVGYIALNQALQRIDTNRVGGVFYNPFYAQQGQNITIYVLVEDDQTPIASLTNNTMKFSLNEDNFSGVPSVTGSFINIGGYDFWAFTISPSLWPVGSTVYMRHYTNDGDHTANTEFPTSNLVHEYKTYWSFYVY